MTTLHIHAPPTVSAYTGRTETKWCFGCCARLEHLEVALLDCSGWYGPTGYWLCPKCEQDCTQFGEGKGLRKNTDVIFPWNEGLKMASQQVMQNIAREQSEAR